MKTDKRVITVDSFEHDLLINGFNEFCNQLLKDEKPTEDVDSLLMKIIDAPYLKEKRRTSYEAR